jgi:hypothetical protein
VLRPELAASSDRCAADVSLLADTPALVLGIGDLASRVDFVGGAAARRAREAGRLGEMAAAFSLA